MEQEKRIRREIANSNERRRMQSINAGFQSLRTLLPHHEGEKLSKAAILQQTADFIAELSREKSRLIGQNNQMKRAMAALSPSNNFGSNNNNNNNNTGETGINPNGNTTCTSPKSPAIEISNSIPPNVPKRRKTLDGAVESGDEGIGSMSPDYSGEESRGELNELRRETMDLRLQLARERRHRMSLEEQLTKLQQQNGVRKIEQKRSQDVDSVDSGLARAQVQQTRFIRDETPRCFTIRNNLETIVEAIRHLEGDHLFSDDRCNSSSSSPSPSSSPKQTEQMDVCSSGNSPTSHHSQSNSMESPIVEVVTTPSSPPPPQPINTTSLTSTATTVTSLKHHVLNRIARSSTDTEEQPINLGCRQNPHSLPNPLATTTTGTSVSTNGGSGLTVVATSNQTTSVQYQLRPGVIVVKQRS